LVDREGKVLRTTEKVKGTLRVEAVEKMLADELSIRDDAMFKKMSEAMHQGAAGDTAAAIALYKQVWDERCLFPLAGAEAQRSLKSLGVVVTETATRAPTDPYLPKPAPKTDTSHN
jgi:hypothetical protein